MKIKNLALIAFISMMTYGITIYGFVKVVSRSVNTQRNLHYQTLKPGSGRSASISKSTALLLLTVGIIGVLTVRRMNKNTRGSVQKRGLQTISNDRNKAFIKLNKQYLDLQYKITLHKSSGVRPPEGLQKEISDLERRVRLISRALE
jgi:hypothetical protein